MAIIGFRFPVNFRLTFEVDRIIKLVYWCWCRRFSFFLFLWTRCLCHITALRFNGQETACNGCYKCNDSINRCSQLLRLVTYHLSDERCYQCTDTSETTLKKDLNIGYFWIFDSYLHAPRPVARIEVG